MSKLIFDLKKPIYAKDKEDGKTYFVESINFPLGSPSGKDITVKTEDVYEWRSIDEVELFQK